MKNPKQTIKCSDCDHCSGFRPLGNTRTEFTCTHPDQDYINDYFHKNRINFYVFIFCRTQIASIWDAFAERPDDTIPIYRLKSHVLVQSLRIIASPLFYNSFKNIQIVR